MRMLRIATRPTIGNMGELSFSLLARNIFAEAMEEMEEEMKEEMDLECSEDDAKFSVGGKEVGALKEHIQCSSVLKKRRRKMRRHKHKKRLRKNRYKARK